MFSQLWVVTSNFKGFLKSQILQQKDSTFYKAEFALQEFLNYQLSIPATDAKGWIVEV